MGNRELEEELLLAGHPSRYADRKDPAGKRGVFSLEAELRYGQRGTSMDTRCAAASSLKASMLKLSKSGAPSVLL